MRVQCVHCGASGEMDETKIPAGATSLKCPRCGQSFPLPALQANAPQTPPPDSIEPAPQAPTPSAAATPQQPPSPAYEPPSPVTPSTSVATASCTICNERLPQSEMVRFGATWVCPVCKPVYVQMLAQGVSRPGERRYAGFWIRLGAKIVDGLILGAAGFLINMITTLVPFSLGGTSPNLALAAGGISFLLQTALAATYSGYFLSAKQATPGKMACGIIVISPDGEKISVMRGVGRYFAELLSSAILCIGYLMICFDDEKRGLHDRICNTRVVYR